MIIYCNNCSKTWNVKEEDGIMLLESGAYHKPCHVSGILEGYIKQRGD